MANGAPPPGWALTASRLETAVKALKATAQPPRQALGSRDSLASPCSEMGYSGQTTYGIFPYLSSSLNRLASFLVLPKMRVYMLDSFTWLAICFGPMPSMTSNFWRSSPSTSVDSAWEGFPNPAHAICRICNMEFSNHNQRHETIPNRHRHPAGNDRSASSSPSL